MPDGIGHAGLRRTVAVLAMTMIAMIVAPDSDWAKAAPHDPPPGVRLIDGYIPRFDRKRAIEARYGDRMEAFRAVIVRRGLAGENLACSSQILDEIDWLVGATADTALIERRFGDLQKSLSLPAQRQAEAGEQSPEDGSWGGCFEAWFLRVWATADPLKRLAAHGEKPRYPLTFLKEIDTPEKIVQRFRRMKISRVQSGGSDYRKELNLTVTGVGQLLFLPELAGMFPPKWPREEVAAALIAFMDEEWQDPETGYWGAWYELGDKVVKTEDLSITFHIASYRNGKVFRLPEMMRTTARIRVRNYPYGWQDRGTQNCHHAYDVVRLVRFGYPMMNDTQKAFARAQLVIITARATGLAINSIGEVDTRPYNRAAEGYYFCASLLDELGYFRQSRNFWSRIEFEFSEELRHEMLNQLERLPQDDPMVDAARRKLQLTD